MKARAATSTERNALAQTLGCHLTPAARGIVAVDGMGEVRGGVLYDCWTSTLVQCHMAVSTPVAWRALLPAVFEYPFLEGGRRVIMGAIRASNTRSLKMAMHLGFEESSRIPHGFAEGDDLVIIYMRREQCRWLKEAH